MKPSLVIMAAGMGSRYGGLKQIDPIDEYGNIIIDFSIYDALKAGFEKIVFIIKKEDEKAFKEVIGNRMEKIIDVEYAFQEVDNLPSGFDVPKERSKPWGTGHAILSCKNIVNEPFAVINADDYYGANAFKMAYEYLSNLKEDNTKNNYMMVGYTLENTLTDNGHVARGVCVIDENGYLKEIHERTQIEKKEDGTYYTEDDGLNWTKIPQGSTVSMNMWGFTKSIIDELSNRFEEFLNENLEKNPLKCEYFLPFVVDEMISEKKAEVKVLKSLDKWYGVTYRGDKEVVVQAIKKLKEDGIYPEKLWEENK